MAFTLDDIDDLIDQITDVWPSIRSCIIATIPYGSKSPQWCPREIETAPVMHQYLQRVFERFEASTEFRYDSGNLYARYSEAEKLLDWPNCMLDVLYEWRAVYAYRPQWVYPWTQQWETYFQQLWDSVMNKHGWALREYENSAGRLITGKEFDEEYDKAVVEQRKVWERCKRRPSVCRVPRIKTVQVQVAQPVMEMRGR